MGADSRPGVAGTRMTRLRPGLLELEAVLRRPRADVLDHRLLVARGARDLRQRLEVRPERTGLQARQDCCLDRHLVTPLPSPPSGRAVRYASAFCLSASNSACVIAPESRSCFALSISAAAPPPLAAVWRT